MPDDVAVDIRLWLQRPAWMAKAACRGLDPDVFFPERGEATWPIKEICRGCEVRNDCLDYAMIMREKFGIWGGMSERERRKLRRRHRPEQVAS